MIPMEAREVLCRRIRGRKPLPHLLQVGDLQVGDPAAALAAAPAAVVAVGAAAAAEPNQMLRQPDLYLAADPL